MGILLEKTSTFLNYIDAAGVIETKTAPGWTLFNAITSSNLMSRLRSDYTFNMTFFSEVPSVSSGGLIVIDLPLEFESVDQTLRCSTPNATFGTPDCQLISSRIYVKGNPSPFRGNLILQISGLRNPLTEVTTDYFYVKTYDGFRKDIIERSFYNLDPFFQTYKYPGPLITIAGDTPVTIEAGT